MRLERLSGLALVVAAHNRGAESLGVQTLIDAHRQNFGPFAASGKLAVTSQPVGAVFAGQAVGASAFATPAKSTGINKIAVLAIFIFYASLKSPRGPLWGHP
jgi:hypothetical protein